MQQFILPAGTICKRGGIPFELATDTVIQIHPDNWPHIRDGFKPSVGIDGQRLFFNQVEQSVEKPCQAAARPVTSTTSNSLVAIFIIIRDVLMFHADEAPDFIDLNFLDREIAHCTVLVQGAGFARIGQQLENGVFALSSNPGRCIHAYSL